MHDFNSMTFSKRQNYANRKRLVTIGLGKVDRLNGLLHDSKIIEKGHYTFPQTK